jgi:hypothetical protein
MSTISFSPAVSERFSARHRIRSSAALWRLSASGTFSLFRLSFLSRFEGSSPASRAARYGEYPWTRIKLTAWAYRASAFALGRREGARPTADNPSMTRSTSLPESPVAASTARRASGLELKRFSLRGRSDVAPVGGGLACVIPRTEEQCTRARQTPLRVMYGTEGAWVALCRTPLPSCSHGVLYVFGARVLKRTLHDDVRIENRGGRSPYIAVCAVVGGAM